GWWALVAVLVAVAIAVGAVVIVGPSDPPTVALLRVDKEGNDINDLISEGFQRAARDFDFEPVVLSAPFTNLRAQLATLAESGADLVMFQDFVFLDAVAQISPEYPDTTWAHIDHGAGGGTTVQFAVNEAAFLAGAAAALTSISGTVGFVGGYQIDATERFRAGFEAGARAINPAIEILARYTSLTPEGFDDVNLARETAITMYREGADVVLHAAGFAGTGVFAAARNESVRQGRQLWAIGADSDEYLEAPAPDRAYILTSAIKRYDVAVYDLIRDYLEGGLEPGVRELALTDGAVGYSTTGGNLSPDTLAMLDQLENDIVSGALVVPRSPTGDLGPPPTELVTRTGTVTYDGVSCRYDGPVVHTYGELVHIDFVNDTSDDAVFALGAPRPADHPQITAPAGGSNEGYIRFEFGPNETWCSSLAADAIDGIAGPTVRVRDARRDDQAESSATSAESRQLLEDSESIARAFLDAVGEFDADRVITHLSDDAIAEAWAEPNGVLIELPVLAAIGYRQTVDACVPRGESSSITYVRCFFDLHALGSAELGLDPYRGNYWDLGLRDGKIVSANSTWTYDANGFAVQVWEP
ncbi:MAG TPA: BMP family ABC transporter substrate-binding protein, partial [Ilumatobacteraceae bacterium]